MENSTDMAELVKAEAKGKRASPGEEEERKEKKHKGITFLSDLTEPEKAALAELKAKLAAAVYSDTLLPFRHQEDISIWAVSLSNQRDVANADIILLKFLRAREFDVDESLKMLRRTLEWRRDNAVDSILEDSYLSEQFGIGSEYGPVDREGHPVCYIMCSAFANAFSQKNKYVSELARWRFERWMIQVLEAGLQKLDLMAPGGVSQVLNVIDLKDYIFFVEDMYMVIKVVQLFQDHYPEFVARNILINIDGVIEKEAYCQGWPLTTRSRSKMVHLYSEYVTEELLKYIPAEAIPVRYGGFRREKDEVFSAEDAVLEMTVKRLSIGTIEIPVPKARTSVVWEFCVVGWSSVFYGEKFVPMDQGTETTTFHSGTEEWGGSQKAPIRNTHAIAEPGKLVITVANRGNENDKVVLYRYRTADLPEVREYYY